MFDGGFWIWAMNWYVNWMYDCNYTPYRCLCVCFCNRVMLERWWWRASWISPGEYGGSSGSKYRTINRWFPLLRWSHLTPPVQSARLETRGCFQLVCNIADMSTTQSFAFTCPELIWPQTSRYEEQMGVHWHQQKKVVILWDFLLPNSILLMESSQHDVTSFI